MIFRECAVPELRAAGLAMLCLRLQAWDTLSSQEKQALFEAADERRTVRAGKDIVRNGVRVETSTLLLSGIASRYNVLKGGSRQITAVHIPGDFADLDGFPLQRLDDAVGAITDCEVLLFPHSNLRAVTGQYPHLARLFWILTLLDGAIHRRWIVGMGRMTAMGHLSHFICEMCVRMNIVGLATDYEMQLPVTQNDLADILGLSVVSVNRVLQKLRTRKVLNWNRKLLRISDWSQLAALAEFEGGYLHGQIVGR